MTISADCGVAEGGGACGIPSLRLPADSAKKVSRAEPLEIVSVSTFSALLGSRLFASSTTMPCKGSKFSTTYGSNGTACRLLYWPPCAGCECGTL
eukprot:CAMPEP_0174712278 /NCGR_PEP_ID=MMETSP1094-20130205/13333_1 /TAXON_ID=156173 /ORGANISM="Chrysochromulina brevifilum, Strain UTEX LB 985" /LENGTH=94 /DNA_ID=CAMNT_0015911335 /DNA_START=54 /DNA_END=338 /DNA_ORIENTATION=+